MTSRYSDDTVFEWMLKNPCVKLESGNIRLPPARLSFPYLFEKQEPMEAGGRSVYAATFLFHWAADLEVAKAAVHEAEVAKWAANMPKRPKLSQPFRDQGDKLNFDGYVAGSMFIAATAERRVPVFDVTQVPIVEEEKVYPGMWVVGFVRPFCFDKTAKKGVSFGLQAVMKVADDEQFGGGAFNMSDAGGITGFDMSRESAPSI